MPVAVGRARTRHPRLFPGLLSRFQHIHQFVLQLPVGHEVLYERLTMKPGAICSCWTGSNPDWRMQPLSV